MSKLYNEIITFKIKTNLNYYIKIFNEINIVFVYHISK
jgi:hypothetical protein